MSTRLNTLLTRTSIMRAQLQDLTQKFVAFETELAAAIREEQERAEKERRAA